MNEEPNNTRQGVLFALGAYGIWGVAPIYFKLLGDIAPYEILSHRVIWSLFFSVILVLLFGLWPKVRAVFRSSSQLRYLTATSLLVGLNWGIFIWAINNDHMLDASLGYYINPLVNVLLATIFLNERLSIWKWGAVVLAFAGGGIELIHLGTVPVISLALAFSFGFYGLLRKKVRVDPTVGMLLETALLIPLALAYLWFSDSETSSLINNDLKLNLLLIAAGPVTMIPLMLFAAAATRIKLSTLGFFQYLGPTLMLFLATGVYGEQLTSNKLITFVFIWAALVVFFVDSIRTHRHQRRTSYS
ncbi:TPA: EamA family transporter RarD [Vibrio parahaemolyticus]|uniref:EamA family transporter RarD n=1 Tax=Vibrio parahaemolyticus TaxID=670 RepID=UPI00248C0CBB|nr:EamA family transporter RarD [Vibrio parahaemolyticus]HBK3326665.1 EamA family transporter RarD [Vibrio parahaemolyticus]